MMNCHAQLDVGRRWLGDVCRAEAGTLAAAWVQALAPRGEGTSVPASPGDTVRQAEAFLRWLAVGLATPAVDPPMSAARDAAVRDAFPACYRVDALFALARVLETRAREDATPLPAGGVVPLLESALATAPLAEAPIPLFTERLGRLSELGWALNGLRDQESILQYTLRTAPALIEATAAALWLWDLDQQAAVLLVTPTGRTPDVRMPGSLQGLLQRASEGGCTFSIDAGETAEDWPATMRHRPIAFIPLMAERGCLGILTVHHLPTGHFTHDDLLLLAALGNVVALTLTNVQLHASEHHLVNLLRTSISRVVQLASGQGEHLAGFVESLLHVAEGLTRADAVGVLIEPGEGEEPVTLVSGSLAGACQGPLLDFTATLAARRRQGEVPDHGMVRAMHPHLTTHALGRSLSYACVDILLGGKPAGVLYALSPLTFDAEQYAFLRSMAEQLGMGVDHLRQSDRIRRLLFELSNVTYVTEAITSTLDSHRIMAIVSKAAHQALHAPVAVCGWVQDDGTVRVVEGTAIGLPDGAEPAPILSLHNATVRKVLEERAAVTHQAVAARASDAFLAPLKLRGMSWACVPLVVKAQGRGLLLVADTRARTFSTREIALLSTYANQAALAIENSRLYEQVDRQLHQMASLHAVTQAVSASLDLDAVFRELLGTVMEAVQASAGLITQADTGTGQQQVRMTREIPSGVPPGTVIPPNDGILGMAAQRRAPITSSHLARDGRSPLLRKAARANGLVSSVTVPIVDRNKVLGTLTVFTQETRAFPQDQIHLLQDMAAAAAVGVRNARLYARERQRAQELAALIESFSGRIADVFAFVGTLLDAARQMDPQSHALARVRERLESLAQMQGVVEAENPADIEVKAGVQRLVHHWQRRHPSTPLEVKVLGTHLLLPTRFALALAAFIDDWLDAARTVAPQATRAAITLQQLGREILVQCDLENKGAHGPIPVNSAILQMLDAVAHGTMATTDHEGWARVSYRCTRPVDTSPPA